MRGERNKAGEPFGKAQQAMREKGTDHENHVFE
jgi:hypothetical protein